MSETSLDEEALDLMQLCADYLAEYARPKSPFDEIRDADIAADSRRDSIEDARLAKAREDGDEPFEGEE